MNNGAVCKKEPSPCHDERFDKVQDQIGKIRGLLQEINEISNQKFNILFGIIPESVSKPAKDKPNNPDCWIGKIIVEQEISIEVCRDILERINSI